MNEANSTPEVSTQVLGQKENSHDAKKQAAIRKVHFINSQREENGWRVNITDNALKTLNPREVLEMRMIRDNILKNGDDSIGHLGISPSIWRVLMQSRIKTLTELDKIIAGQQLGLLPRMGKDKQEEILNARQHLRELQEKQLK